MENRMNQPGRRKHTASSQGFRWDTVDVKRYPAEGTRSRGMTKQVLFNADEDLTAELRYFEAEKGGFSALERHQHVHAVMVIRGKGRVLIGETVTDIDTFDTVYIPPNTWHQFYADRHEPLGFLCLVNGDRDRPSRPTEDELAVLRAHPEIGKFVQG